MGSWQWLYWISTNYAALVIRNYSFSAWSAAFNSSIGLRGQARETFPGKEHLMDKCKNRCIERRKMQVNKNEIEDED